MKCETERSEGLSCIRKDCHYLDDTYDQSCSKEQKGEPGPSFCEGYTPMKMVYCHECSKAGGASLPIYHAPPKCNIKRRNPKRNNHA